jgi:gamma-glutamylputrescine oxidase
VEPTSRWFAAQFRRARDEAALRDAVFWFDRKEPPLAALAGSIRADVVVVGGGIMGLMCAKTLLARGQRVCLVEADTCGAGASGRSSGLITPDSELELRDLLAQFGTAAGRKLWEFAAGGVNAIRQTVLEDRIDCDLQAHDACFVATNPAGAEVVSEEHAARQACDYRSTLYSREHLPEILGSTAYFGALRFGDTFGIDGYRTCAGLRDRLRDRGAQIFERSPVTEILENGVETPGGSARGSAVIICADRFLPELGLARREIYHVQTFLAISEPLGSSDIDRMFPRGPLMVWGTDIAYKYFRLTGDQRLLIGGGTLTHMYSRREQHRPRQVERELTRYLAVRFPGLRIKFAACWPGLIGITKDFAPVVGSHPGYSSVHFAAGAAGLPWAAALGRYLAEKVLDGRNDIDAELTVNRRFPIGPRLQAVLGAPGAFAISHGILKYLS